MCVCVVCVCSPAAESFGVSAEIGSGVVRGGYDVRFRRVPRRKVTLVVGQTKSTLLLFE